ncbi:unnamed protein product [Caenorhabditis brenneri]
MNRFITRTKQSNKTDAQKLPVPTENAHQNLNNENVANTAELLKEKSSGKLEEPSIMTKLQRAIRDNDAQLTFDMLSRNRPFDNGMNKHMTKLEFSPSYSQSSSEYMLLSVDESVIDAFKEGQSLTIRGDSTDDAILCTEKTTFPMKIIESATTVLLLHNCLGAPDSSTLPEFQVETIDGKCFSCGELCPAIDYLNIGRLKDMLREQELRWDWKDREEEENLKGYRLRELLDSVQMSVGEMKIALADLPVIKFQSGRYRYLSHKFRGEMIGLIVELLDEDSDVTLESMTFAGLRNFLPDNVPDQVIEWFLKSRCEIVNEATKTYRLPEVNLIRDLTVVILYGNQKMPLQQFNVLLSKILPVGVKVEDGMFEGVADVSDAPFGKVITYLSPEDLPDTVKERMLFLFDYRKLWTMDQLRPYFRDIYKSKVSFDNFVVQNCEYSISDSNVVLYCGLK